jgi:hypothetical protein
MPVNQVLTQELQMPPSSHESGPVIGIDVQLSRGLAYAVMDPQHRVVANGWLDPDSAADVVATLQRDFRPRAIGIDAPRCPLSTLRNHYWSGGRWRLRQAGDRGFGRHCEVVISACGLARPQWTPPAADAPAWMRYGFDLFSAAEQDNVEAAEVFPSAAYRQLIDDPTARMEMPLHGFAPGPKDMLDAATAAFSLVEYLAGRGTAVGGGDSLGRIILPRPVRHPSFDAVSAWPRDSRHSN